MDPVTVRNIKIGEGRPKICVPIVETGREEIAAQARALAKLPLDMAEWRADWYTDAKDCGKAVETAAQLREALGDIPLLFTFRTAKEGGAARISEAEYVQLNTAVARSGYADLIDVEVCSFAGQARGIIREVQSTGVKAVASSHDFDKTPPKEELLGRLHYMKELGADIWKIAVMPNCGRDVLTLLDATLTVREEPDSRPVITMSMGSMGTVSRLAGEVFGSSVTFAAAGKTSAPGQVNVDRMVQFLETLHV